MTDPKKIFHVIHVIYLVAALIAVIVMTVQLTPVIKGDVLLEESNLLTRSQMTAWIVWMNTVFMYGLGALVFSIVNKWLKKE